MEFFLVALTVEFYLTTNAVPMEIFVVPKVAVDAFLTPSLLVIDVKPFN